MHSVSDGSRPETIFNDRREYIMFQSMVDPSTPTTSTTYFPSEEQTKFLFQGECELDDLEHDMMAYATRLRGVRNVECVPDDSGRLIAVRVDHCESESQIVKKSISRSIDMTIAILKKFSPILGGYA